jgi:hypothetical protein
MNSEKLIIKSQILKRIIIYNITISKRSISFGNKLINESRIEIVKL